MKINLQQPRATKVLFSGQDHILSKSKNQSVFFVSLPLPTSIVSANHPRGSSFEDTTNSGTKKPSKKSVGQDITHSFISTATSNFASSQRHGRSGNRSVAMIGIDRNQGWTTSKPTSRLNHFGGHLMVWNHHRSSSKPPMSYWVTIATPNNEHKLKTLSCGYHLPLLAEVPWLFRFGGHKLINLVSLALGSSIIPFSHIPLADYHVE